MSKFFGVLVALLIVAALSALAADPCNGNVKYYRNPMGTADTSPVPKKDSMNMDYIPVCANDAAAAPGTVKLSLDRVQRLGVRSDVVQERALNRVVRAFASVQFDERKHYTVAPRYGGWIEKLWVNAIGDKVSVGQPLFEVYSPELVKLQREWALASTSDYALEKLRNVDYPEDALERLKRGERPRTITIKSAVAGTVIEKPALQGMYFNAGDALFHIVDTSSMWVLGEVYEQDLAYVKVGDTAKVTINAFPERTFSGKVTFIYPSLGKESRTARLRIELANPDGLLRADMAATIEIETPLAKTLAAPESAIIDTGDRQIVLVERGEGLYEPRQVKLGARVPGWVQVLAGLKPGERVVTSATFLIDAESNIRAALAAFGAGDGK